MAPRSLVVRLGLVVLISAAATMAADQPPRGLHLVGDHWTAWDPPTPPAGQQVYTIVKGDTLWDLAKKFNGNPYLWPQLWEKNQYIKDAHWIYAGDPLVTGLQVEPAQDVGAQAAAATAATPADLGAPVTGVPGGDTASTGAPSTGSAETNPEPAPAGTEMRGVLTAGAATSGPQPLGAESDIYCMGYIGDDAETFSYRITGSEYLARTPDLAEKGLWGRPEAKARRDTPSKLGLDAGDIVYLDGGQSSGLSPGGVFSVVESGPQVRHPVTSTVVGRLYRYLGRVRVLSVQEKTAIAEVLHSCAPIAVGAALKPFEPEPIPLGRRTAPRPVNEPADAVALATAPVVLYSGQGIISMGQEHVVYIDRGSDDQVTPGDTFTIYRLNRDGFPPVPIGELAVLAAQRHTAIAKITESASAIFVGDRLELK